MVRTFYEEPNNCITVNFTPKQKKMIKNETDEKVKLDIESIRASRGLSNIIISGVQHLNKDDALAKELLIELRHLPVTHWHDIDIGDIKFYPNTERGWRIVITVTGPGSAYCHRGRVSHASSGKIYFTISSSKRVSTGFSISQNCQVNR